MQPSSVWVGDEEGDTGGGNLGRRQGNLLPRGPQKGANISDAMLLNPISVP